MQVVSGKRGSDWNERRTIGKKKISFCLPLSVSPLEIAIILFFVFYLSLRYKHVSSESGFDKVFRSILPLEAPGTAKRKKQIRDQLLKGFSFHLTTLIRGKCINKLAYEKHSADKVSLQIDILIGLAGECTATPKGMNSQKTIVLGERSY